VNTPKAYNEVFNIGADKPYTINELVGVVCKHLNAQPNTKYLQARKEVVHAYSDHAKAHRIFGTDGAVSLDEGIKKMAAWAKVVGARKSQEFNNVEIRKNMPEGW
jgi:UDP-glucose 4-epimerase